MLPLYAWDMAASVVRLARFIRREGFDLVLTNSAKADIYGGMAGWLARRPVVWRLHDIVDSETFNRLNRFLFRAGATLFATRVLAVSEAVRQALVGLGVPAGKVVTVYNGIDLEATEKAAGDEDMRSGLGIDASAPVAGFVGRLVDWKGVDYFIRAAALVARELPEARFLVVGDVMFGEQDYADSLKPLASELGLDGQNHLHRVAGGHPRPGPVHGRRRPLLDTGGAAGHGDHRGHGPGPPGGGVPGRGRAGDGGGGGDGADGRPPRRRGHGRRRHRRPARPRHGRSGWAKPGRAARPASSSWKPTPAVWSRSC